VTNWKNGEMALRWAAGAFIETDKSHRKVLGYRHLWILKAHLDDQGRLPRREERVNYEGHGATNPPQL